MITLLFVIGCLVASAQQQSERRYETHLLVGAGYAANCRLSFETENGREEVRTGNFAIGNTRTLVAPGDAVNVEYSCRAVVGETVFTFRFPQQNGNHCFQITGTTLNTRYTQHLCGDDGVDCFDRDVRYGGGFVSVASTFSEFHCQVECELEAACEFFNFFEGQCVMLAGMEPIGDSQGTVSGPKNCPGTPRATEAPTPPPTPTEAPVPTEAPAGGCTNENDRALILTDPQVWDNKVSGCAVPCFGVGECVARCLETDVGVTTECADCYGDTSQCTTDNCFFPCLLNPASQGCRDCSRLNCRAALLECTGFEDGEIPGKSYALNAAVYIRDEDYLKFKRSKE